MSETQTQGARAALELQLSDTQRKLQSLIEEKNELQSRADECRALAAEGRASARNNATAASLRLEAFALGGRIAPLKLRVANLESQLKSAPAQVAPVVLTREQVAAQDETMDYRAQVAA